MIASFIKNGSHCEHTPHVDVNQTLQGGRNLFSPNLVYLNGHGKILVEFKTKLKFLIFSDRGSIVSPN